MKRVEKKCHSTYQMQNCVDHFTVGDLTNFDQANKHGKFQVVCHWHPDNFFRSFYFTERRTWKVRHFHVNFPAFSPLNNLKICQNSLKFCISSFKKNSDFFYNVINNFSRFVYPIDLISLVFCCSHWNQTQSQSLPVVCFKLYFSQILISILNISRWICWLSVFHI